MDQRAEEEPGGSKPGCGIAALALSGAGVLVASGLTVMMGYGSLYPFVLLVTLAIVAIVGGPAFLRIREDVTWRKVVLAGLLTGAIFPAVLGLPSLAYPSEYLLMVGGFGLAGIAGAMIAWLLASWLLNGGLGAKAGVALLVAAGVAAMWIVPWALMDRSCHNFGRNGLTSISPIAGFHLNVTMAEWPEVREELDRFAREEGSQIRKDIRPDPGFPWFQVSLCREPGTIISVDKAAFEEDQISIHAFQPQGGDSWRAPLRELQDRLERRWPGGIGHREFDGPRSPWAPASPTPTDAPLRPAEISL